MRNLHRWLTITHLQGNVPRHVDMAFKLVHPNFGDPQGVPPHVGRQVLGVGLMSALDVGDARTRQDFDAAAALPHLRRQIANTRRNTVRTWRCWDGEAHESGGAFSLLGEKAVNTSLHLQIHHLGSCHRCLFGKSPGGGSCPRPRRRSPST